MLTLDEHIWNCEKYKLSTFNVLFSDVVVLLVGLDLLDKHFKATAVSFEQHYDD
jgi:hypothetical protein